MSPPRLVLRGYRTGDLDALFAIDEACFEPQFRFSRADLRRYVESKNARVAIGEIDGELAGFCILHLQRDGAGYITTIDVALQYRQQGVAHALMGAVESQAREAHCESMLLHVFEGNAGAIHFYEREGYTLEGLARNFYGTGVNALIYRKALKPAATSSGH